MSRSPPRLHHAATDRAAERAVAQILRALEAKPGVAALCAPLDLGRACLAALAGNLGPDLRAVVVQGGPLDPDALCAQALRVLGAMASDEPRVVFEAYLSHLRSRGKGLALLVEEADALPPATLDFLVRWVRCPASVLRLVAAGRDPTALGWLVDLCGACGPLVVLARAASQEPTQRFAAAQGDGWQPQLRHAGPPAAPGLDARRRRHIAWPVGAAALLAISVALRLLWSLATDEVESPLAVGVSAPGGTARAMQPPEPGAASSAPVGPSSVAALPGPDAGVSGVQSEAEPQSWRAEASDAGLPSSQALEATLGALDAGDVEAYKRALRRLEGLAARHAAAELLRRLEESPLPEGRGKRMLAAWGLGLVGGHEALSALDLAAGDADRHVAALAARSAAVIRARLGPREPDPTPP